MVSKRLLCDDVHEPLPPGNPLRSDNTENSPMMRRTLLLGVALAATVALLVDHAGQFGHSMTNVALLGAALGAAVGLVPDGSPIGRIVAALVGMVVTQLGYGIRAPALPALPAGRAIAAAAVVLVLTGVCIATGGRLRLWALLLGAGAFVGAYETVYVASPTTFVSDSFAMATAVSLGAAIGFAAASLTSAFTSRPVVSVHDAEATAAYGNEPTLSDLPRQRAFATTATTARSEA